MVNCDTIYKEREKHVKRVRKTNKIYNTRT